MLEIANLQKNNVIIQTNRLHDFTQKHKLQNTHPYGW